MPVVKHVWVCRNRASNGNEAWTFLTSRRSVVSDFKSGDGNRTMRRPTRVRELEAVSIEDAMQADHGAYQPRI